MHYNFPHIAHLPLVSWFCQSFCQRQVGVAWKVLWCSQHGLNGAGFLRLHPSQKCQVCCSHFQVYFLIVIFSLHALGHSELKSQQSTTADKVACSRHLLPVCTCWSPEVLLSVCSVGAASDSPSMTIRRSWQHSARIQLQAIFDTLTATLDPCRSKCGAPACSCSQH